MPDISVMELSFILGAAARTIVNVPNIRSSKGRRSEAMSPLKMLEAPPSPTEMKTWSMQPREARA